MNRSWRSGCTPSDTAVHVAWLGLGSNLAAPAVQLDNAVAAIAALAGSRLLAVSDFYRTAPVGGPPGQPDFCNACAAIATRWLPLQLLDALQAIEVGQGRERSVVRGPRTLDLDMLAFDELALQTERLTCPHPRAARRAFVLVPLADIAPALTLGGYGRVVDCLAECDTNGVRRW